MNSVAEIQAKIDLFNYLFIASVAIAILGFALAVLLFFRFRVPELLALSTGRARQRTLERMREQSNAGGSLRQTKSSSRELRASAARAVETGGKPTTQDFDPGEKETSLLGTTPDTSLLQNAPDTSLLSGRKLETTVLGRFRQNDSARTQILSRKAPDIDVSGHLFQITETIMLIHTDELI